MEQWPSSILPDPTVDFGGELDQSVIKTPMDSSRIRQRRRFTREQRNYNVTWSFKDFEFGMFESWVLHKINGGADAFNIYLPVGGDRMNVLVEAKLRDGKYTWRYDNVLYWKVSANLMVEDAKVWDEETYDTLLELGGSPCELEDAAARLHTLVTTTLPSYGY
jgi:hypothetical protein